MRTTIERAHDGTLLFLKCGCAAYRVTAHPTGAAFLVQIQQPCDSHASTAEQIWSILKGELVSEFTRST